MIRSAAAVCLVAAFVGAAGTRAHTSALVTLAPQPVGVATIGGLPDGLRWPSGDASRPVLQAIAADIDADGDLDIVANQGTLDLAVWVNDGTGQLTRVAPRESSGHMQAFPPAVSDRASESQVPAAPATPVFDAALRAGDRMPLTGSGAPTGPPHHRPASADGPAGSPRAPPPDSSR